MVKAAILPATSIAPEMLHHKFLVREIAQAIGCQRYLELGVCKGDTLREVARVVPNCVAVDSVHNKEIDSVPNCKFYHMTTDQFFAEPAYGGKGLEFDLIFIDADHAFEQVKKDFDRSLSLLSYGGVILLHDTDPSDPEYLVPDHCNDCWQVVDWLAGMPKLSVVTLPVSHCGLTIVTRKGDRRVLGFIDRCS